MYMGCAGSQTPALSSANGFIPPWYLHVSRGSQHGSEWVLVQLELTHAEGNGYPWVLKVFVPLPSGTS